LKELIILDDGFDIEKAWGIKEQDFTPYEESWGIWGPNVLEGNLLKRVRDLLNQSPVDLSKAYVGFIGMGMKLRFAREEGDYHYMAPLLTVMGWALSPSVEIP
jgi:hypothetical protein